ncbi:MAG: M3 family oligoendopeptidase [Lachnospiraceae bacterium]|nr:M3 family oligoendopeptidase [Lachnospiraceae bacterium]
MKFSEMPYERIDVAKTREALEALIGKIGEVKSGEELFAVHEEYTALSEELFSNITIAQIRHSIDTTDEFYEKENDFYDENLPLIQDADMAYKKALYESPYREEMAEITGPVMFRNIELAMKAFDPKIIPFMQEENALSTRYSKLIATAKIEFNGETCNLTRMRVFQTSDDREVRKAAWKAVSGWFLSVTDEIDEIYDKMVKVRTEMAKAMGYENYIELGYYRMNRNDYGREMVENFRRQVKESFVPFVSELSEKRRVRLGLDALKYYDGVYFPEGNPKPHGTPQEILEAGQKMYHDLAPETGEFMDFMMDNELFDVLGRPTKEQGGYMTYIPKYKSPFVFANFNGTSADVDVITHECGHAFQGYLVRDEKIAEHRDITMETAEIHSMSMEYFTYDYMDRFFGERADDYRTMHFEDACAFLPYGCMVDEFQHIIYEKPELMPAERKLVWKELEKVYRPDTDFDGDPFFGEGGWWQRQGHIFGAPFYYIDYVLASVCAMQYKVKMDEDYRAAWASYLALCRLSAKKFYREELREAGLDIPFEDGTIEKLTANLKKKVL